MPQAALIGPDGDDTAVPSNAVDEQDLVAYLTSKGIQTYRSAGSEISIHCMNCEDGESRGKGKLYLNTESWLWGCFKCEFRGNRKTLIEFFGDTDALAYAPGADPFTRRRILTEAAQVAHDMLLGNEAMCQYLLDRGISAEVIVSERLGYVPKNVGLSAMLPNRERYTYKDLIGSGLLSAGGKEFFNDSLVIPYWSHGTVIQLRARMFTGDAKYLTMGGNESYLYNGDALFGAVEVLVVEGEFDADAVRSALLNCGDRRMESLAVVAVAGAGSWPYGLVERLSRADKIFIGFDHDTNKQGTGQKFAKKLKEEIGTKARTVDLPPDTDWSNLLSARSGANPNGGKDWRDVRDLLIEADLAGKRLFTIRDAGTKWRKMRDEAPGIKLGFASMDAILRPGLKPGQVMIPLAATGTGKSVFLSNVAHNVRSRGVLYLSLELTASEVFEHFRRIHKFWNPTATPEQMLEDYALLQIVEQNRLRPGDLGQLIEEYEQATAQRPSLVIVDYLQYYARGFRGTSAHDRANDAVMELKAVAKEEQVAVMAPSQVNRASEPGKPITLNGARDSGVVEETGDFVMSLFRPSMAVQSDPNVPPPPSASLTAQLLKSRHGGSGRVFNLRMSPLSLVVVDSLDKKNTVRIEQESSLARQGVHYDDYRKQLDAQNGQSQLPGVTP